MLTPESIQTFKQLYEEEQGQSISDEKATELAMSLINLAKVIFRPIPEGDKNEQDTKNKNQIASTKDPRITRGDLA